MHITGIKLVSNYSIDLICLDNQESERIEWLGEIEQMKFNISQAHQVEQEILKKKQEISELQKALSDSHLAIYDEKNTVSSLRLQYEDLLKTEKAD